MTINLKENSINEKAITPSSFLYRLKKAHTLLRIVEIKNEELKLINKKTPELPKLGTGLKAMIMLFPREERYNALKLLKAHFDIRITSSQVEELKNCLLQDPAFNNLLPFKQKKLLENLLVSQDEKRNISYWGQKKGKETANPIRNKNFMQHSKQSLKVFNRNKFLQLKLSITSKSPEARINFFKCSATKNGYQTLIPNMKIEEFKNFIELFPPKDAIKLLNYSMIREQVAGFNRQGQLAEQSYIDLLNYFGPYQKDSVKKLLRPISPIINTRLVIFKERMDKKEELTERLPDIVMSTHMPFRTR